MTEDAIRIVASVAQRVPVDPTDVPAPPPRRQAAQRPAQKPCLAAAAAVVGAGAATGREPDLADQQRGPPVTRRRHHSSGQFDLGFDSRGGVRVRMKGNDIESSLRSRHPVHLTQELPRGRLAADRGEARGDDLRPRIDPADRGRARAEQAHIGLRRRRARPEQRVVRLVPDLPAPDRLRPARPAPESTARPVAADEAPQELAPGPELGLAKRRHPPRGSPADPGRCAADHRQHPHALRRGRGERLVQGPELVLTRPRLERTPVEDHPDAQPRPPEPRPFARPDRSLRHDPQERMSPPTLRGGGPRREDDEEEDRDQRGDSDSLTPCAQREW